MSQDSSFKLSLQALKEKPHFGSGPGTYAYDFSKFKDPEFNKSPLWSMTFNKATSRVLNDLATVGLLGFVAILTMMIFPIFYGIQLLFKKSREAEQKNNNWILALGLTSALITQSLMYFLYNSNMVLELVFFFVIGALVVLVVDKKKQYELKPSSLQTLAATLIFTIVFIFGLGILFLNGQRYVAEMNYLNGLESWQAGNKDQAIKEIETAASMNSSSDLYFRQLSQAYLLKLQDELQKTGTKAPSDEQKAKVQVLVANSVNAAKIATDISSKNVANWSMTGFVYQNMFGLIGDAESWALSSYNSALGLDPNNPYLLAQKGIVLFASSSKLGDDQKDKKIELLNQSKTQLEKAVSLNPGYSNGLYYLGLVYDALGQKNKAIEQFTKISQLNPQNTDILKIIENLKAGRSAFETALPAPETPPTDSKDGAKATDANTKAPVDNSGTKPKAK
jgi:tetratricopeptide (TPR) repeat protein